SKDISQAALDTSDYVRKFLVYDQANPFKKKNFRAITGIKKSENPEDFRIRLKQWREGRDEDARKPWPRPRNYTPDPGRIREHNLDETPEDTGNPARDNLREAIKEAKKGIKT
ncbi:MAG: hypothetical protein ACREGB_00270, partial [Candidatus Saccharimonadales bacterium]